MTRAIQRGVAIDFLSIYPKEKEYLYPPLTCTSCFEQCAEGVQQRHFGLREVFESRASVLQPERTYDEAGYTIVEVTPMMN